MYLYDIYIYMCHCVLDWVEGPQCDLRPGKARPMDSQYNNTLYYIILYHIILYCIKLYHIIIWHANMQCVIITS